MKKKLTLVINEQVTARAKRLAHQEGTTVSEMVERYLDSRTAELERWSPEPGSLLDKVTGRVKHHPEDPSNEALRIREIRKKHA